MAANEGTARAVPYGPVHRSRELITVAPTVPLGGVHWPRALLASKVLGPLALEKHILSSVAKFDIFGMCGKLISTVSSEGSTNETGKFAASCRPL